MDLKAKKLLVIGLARTGRECARFLAQQGAKVWISDLRGQDDLRGEMAALGDLADLSRLGGEEKSWLDGMDYVVPSPGVPRGNLLLREALARKIPVLSEIELAYRFFAAPLIAITGTNGKSTTTALSGKVLARPRAGQIFCGGNLEHPLIDAVTTPANAPDGLIVDRGRGLQLEEWIDAFRPQSRRLPNLTEDHLDRFANIEVYAPKPRAHLDGAARGRRRRSLNARRALDYGRAAQSACRTLWSPSALAESGPRRLRVRRHRKELVLRFHEALGLVEETYPVAEAQITAAHNVENIDVPPSRPRVVVSRARRCTKAREEFPAAEAPYGVHRRQGRFRYFDDSKGTNVDAVPPRCAAFRGR